MIIENPTTIDSLLEELLNCQYNLISLTPEDYKLIKSKSAKQIALSITETSFDEILRTLNSEISNIRAIPHQMLLHFCIGKDWPLMSQIQETIDTVTKRFSECELIWGVGVNPMTEIKTINLILGFQ
jgi:hypothetical protein